jgi:hypothetical protein
MQTQTLTTNNTTEAENIHNAAKEDTTFEKLLKFRKGAYFIGNDEVPLGSEFLAHCVGWTKAWIKFIDNKLVDRKVYRVALGERPVDRNDLDELERAETDNDPWTMQYMLPLESTDTGEVYIFITSSIGGKRAVSNLCDQFAKRKLRGGIGTDGQPIVRLMADEMTTKNFGNVPCPKFLIHSWDERENLVHEVSKTAIPAYTEKAASDDMDDSIPF